MTSVSIPKIKRTVFNPNYYISTSTDYLTKSEADELYINELPESVERLIGNINVVGEETVTSQVVTGNCLIGGNLTSGQDGFNGTIATTSIIKGNITLGDQNNTGTSTTAPGQVTLGWSQPINIRGSTVAINIENANGATRTIIGNGSNPLTVNTGLCTINAEAGATGCYIGRESSGHTTKLLGNVSIGQAGIGTTTILKGDVTLSDDLTVAGSATIGNTGAISIRGSSIDMNTTSVSGNLLVGRTGLDPNAGQTNTFLSSQNRIYTPRLCDNAGNLLGQNFNLNNPSHFVFNQNLKYENGAYTYCDTSSIKNVVFYLNTPPLVANQVYTVFFDFHYYVITGKGVDGGGTVTPNTSVLNKSYSNSLSSASRAIHSTFCLVITKESAADGGYTFSYVNTTQSGNPFVTWTFPGSPATTTPLGFSKQMDGKIRVNIQFPRMNTDTYSLSNNFMITMGSSLRICNSNVNGTAGNGNEYGFFPNNSIDSCGGSCLFSLN